MGMAVRVRSQRPGVQANNPTATLAGQGDLRQCAILSTDSNNDIGGLHNQHIACMTHTSSNGNMNKWIGRAPISTGENADSETTGRSSAATGRLHHAAQPTTHKEGVCLGNATANLFGEHSSLRITDTRTAYSDNGLPPIWMYQSERQGCCFTREGIEKRYYTICVPTITINAPFRTGAL